MSKETIPNHNCPRKRPSNTGGLGCVDFKLGVPVRSCRVPNATPAQAEYNWTEVVLDRPASVALHAKR